MLKFPDQIKTTLLKDFTSLLLEWLLSRTQTTANVGKDVGKGNPHILLVVI
jgi:hypothetical protein